MVRSRKLCRALVGVLIGTTFMMGADMTADAKTAGKSYLDEKVSLKEKVLLLLQVILLM